MECKQFTDGVTTEMFGKILDLLVLNNQEVILLIIDVTRQLINNGRIAIMEEMWYVGRLIFALERLDNQHKYRLVNLVRDLMFVKVFNENFRRINGTTTLINEYRKSINN